MELISSEGNNNDKEWQYVRWQGYVKLKSEAEQRNQMYRGQETGCHWSFGGQWV